MYRHIGEAVSRFPVPWIVVWVVFCVAAVSTSPSFLEVWQDGEFAFLPADTPSRQAEDLFRKAFPAADGERFAEDRVGTSVQQDPLGSNIVIVLQRDDRRTGLTNEDREFIEDVLLPELEQVKRTTPRGYRYVPTERYPEIPSAEQVIRGISTLQDRRIGTLLVSQDEKATLVVVELKTEFLDRQNGLVLERVEELLTAPYLQARKPLGLSMALSGSATVGRDMLRAEKISASRTETFTRVLVIVLLLMIYRAPLLALVPLVTVGVAVELSLALLRHMASWGWIGMFTGLEVYVTVVVYGAGVDYCLFLIARYKEELETGASFQQAVSTSIQRVGAALATSAGTSICGIAMMGLSDFGKFGQAGFAISFGLAVVLCFALTFTPAFLLLFKNWAFWPDVRRERVSTQSGFFPSSSLWQKIQEQRWLEQIWTQIGDALLRRPGTIFLVTVLIMMPFAGIGVAYQNNLSYGLLTDLPQDEPSVRGARAVQEHFPAGVTGPITLFLEFDEDVLHREFNGRNLAYEPAARRFSNALTERLIEIAPGLGIVDVRNQTHPLGMTKAAREYMDSLAGIDRRIAQSFAHRTYTSHRGPLAGTVMRIDLVLDLDPFSREATDRLSQIEAAVMDVIPETIQHREPDDELDDDPDEEEQATETSPSVTGKTLRESARIYPLGTTSGIRDLKKVTARDRIVIAIGVIVVVYLVLLAMLRMPAICAYLILSVGFSFLVSLGMTFVVFYLRDPTGFTGIDWKVPVYLLTILIAMGEDYNILLMARVTEEQEKHGLVRGVISALTKTGSIISSCGIIMAGTFASLMSGTLLGMVQLGFALAFGVLLDTFIVRPILVPAYLILLYSGRFGRLGRFLGAPAEANGDEPTVATE
jgi:putative drug exporter of the RND superfamily